MYKLVPYLRYAVLGAPYECYALQEVYAALPAVNFSQSILAQSAYRLGVLRVHGVHWSDWGAPQRILRDLLAKLPAGQYTVTAEHNGQTLTKTVRVAPHKPAHAMFLWTA